jgi:IS605 OrfB family transposase
LTTLGIDLNAFPANIAWAEVDVHGNYKGSGVISTPHLYDARRGKRDHHAWQAAHEIVEIAKKQQKGIVLENLNFDRSKKTQARKLRRCYSNFSYRKLKENIYNTAKREGVSVREVNPAYTSKIGALKYAPQFNLSRHTGAAMVIARRGLGFRERLPKSYQKEASDAILISPQCKPNGGTSVHQWKEEASAEQHSLKTIWSVLWVVVLTGHSTGKMNFSILKKKLVQGHGGKHGLESHGLDPPLGSGSRRTRDFVYT